MVIDLADVNFPPTQECKISSNQGIMIPLWVGWCDTGTEKAAPMNIWRIAQDDKI